MEDGAVQTTASFVGSHQGITIAFIALLIGLIGYLWVRLDAAKENSAKAVVNGLQDLLLQQRTTIDSTLSKLNQTVEKLEKTISELAAELFRDMKNLDRRLSKLEGEHEATHLRMRRQEDRED